MAVRITASGGLTFTGTLDDRQITEATKRVQKNIMSMGNAVEREGERMNAVLARAGAALTAYFSIQAGKGLIQHIIEVRGEFQQLEIAFTTMLQSKEKADALMAQVVDLAATTPFGLRDAAQGAKQLLAYGSAADTVIGELRMIGDIASGVSAPLNDLVYLYGTLRTQGRAYAVDIRQFAGRGIPIYAELAKVMGINVDQVSKFVEAGKVGFKEVEKAFQNMTSQGGMFYNLMAEQSKSLTGQISNLKDQIDVMFNEIGKGNQELLASGIEGVAYLVEHYREIGKILGILLATYGSYRVAVALVNVTEAARAKNLAGMAHLLGQNVRDELLAVQMIRDKAIATQEATIAEYNNLKAKEASLRADVAAAAAAKEKIAARAVEKTQAAQAAAVQATLARQELASLQATNANSTAKAIETAQIQANNAAKQLAAAQDAAGVARQNALSASTDFHTKKKALETTAVELNTARKAASNATNAAMTAITNANTVATTRLTLAQHAQALASTIANKAQALLNATMLSNPIVATIAIVGGLVTAYFMLRDTTTAAEKAQERLNKANEEAANKADELRSRTQELTAIINDDTQTKADQILAFQQLQLLYGDRFRYLTLEQFKLKGITQQQKELNTAINAQTFDTKLKQYDEAVSKANELYKTILQINAGESKAAAGVESKYGRKYEEARLYAEGLKKQIDQIREAEKLASMSQAQKLEYYKSQKAEIEKQIIQWELYNGKIIRGEGGVISLGKNLKALSINGLITQFNTLIGQIDALNKGIKPDGPMTVQEINDQIAKLQDKQKGTSTRKAYAEFQKQIEALERQRAEITGEILDKKALNAQKKLAEERKKLMEELAEAERKQTISQMVEGQRQVEEIRERYFKIREEYKKVKLDLSKPENAAIANRLNTLENTEIDNLIYNRDTAQFSKFLNEQKSLYDSYEQYKLDVGEDAAKAEFKNKIDTEKTFLDVVRQMRNQFEKDEEGKASTDATQNRRLVFFKAEMDAVKELQETNREWQVKAIQDYSAYEQKKINIQRKYQTEIDKANKTGNKSYLAELERLRNEEYKALDEDYAKRLLSASSFFDSLVLNSKSAVQAQIKNIEQILESTSLDAKLRSKLENDLKRTKGLLKVQSSDLEFTQLQNQLELVNAEIKKVEKETPGATETLAQLYSRRTDLNLQLADASLKKITTRLQVIASLSGSVQDLGDSLQTLGGENSTLAELGGIISTLGANLGNLTKLFDKEYRQGITNMQAYATAAQFVIQAISGIINAAAQRKQKLADFNAQLLSMQTSYNAALIEEIRLRHEMQSSVFFQGYASRVQSGLAASVAAVNAYTKALEELQDAQVKVGTKKKTNWSAVWQSTLTGAAAGATAGSAVAGIGAVIGGVVGGVVGFVTGLFKKKRVDVYDNLLKTYPDLIDAEGRLNKARADSLLQSGLLDAKSKELLQNVKNLAEEYEKAKAQIDQVITDLSGQLASDLMGKLEETFRQGGANAGQAFVDAMKPTLANIGKNLLFEALFADEFKLLEKQIRESFNTEGTSGMARIFAEWGEKNKGLGSAFVEAMKEYEKMMAEMGYDDVFGTKDPKNRNSLTGGFASASQESIDLLSGQTMGMRLAQLETNVILNKSLEICNLKLASLLRIEGNTYNTVVELQTVVAEFKILNKAIKDADLGNGRHMGGG